MIAKKLHQQWMTASNFKPGAVTVKSSVGTLVLCQVSQLITGIHRGRIVYEQVTDIEHYEHKHLLEHDR